MTTMTATMTAQPTTDRDGRTDRRLRTAGMAALVAAAMGSVLGASPAMSEAPSTDRHCRMDIVGSQWFSSGCTDEPAATTAR
ncbi:hypothetical protein Pve01_93310 [Planomonospora venezuelensis]|nr:hypothetical protein Pve01_93310 [Planomonospora venezuelensis]